MVQRHLTQLGLTPSPERTKLTLFRDGFTFLGFAISSWSVTMRPKSMEKLKTKIRQLTVRKHNLDQDVVQKVNAGAPAIRGTANGRTASPPRFPKSAICSAAWTAGYACVSAA